MASPGEREEGELEEGELADGADARSPRVAHKREARLSGKESQQQQQQRDVVLVPSNPGAAAAAGAERRQGRDQDGGPSGAGPGTTGTAAGTLTTTADPVHRPPAPDSGAPATAGMAVAGDHGVGNAVAGSAAGAPSEPTPAGTESHRSTQPVAAATATATAADGATAAVLAGGAPSATPSQAAAAAASTKPGASSGAPSQPVQAAGAKPPVTTGTSNNSAAGAADRHAAKARGQAAAASEPPAKKAKKQPPPPAATAAATAKAATAPASKAAPKAGAQQQAEQGVAVARMKERRAEARAAYPGTDQRSCARAEIVAILLGVRDHTLSGSQVGCKLREARDTGNRSLANNIKMQKLLTPFDGILEVAPGEHDVSVKLHVDALHQKLEAVRRTAGRSAKAGGTEARGSKRGKGGDVKEGGNGSGGLNGAGGAPQHLITSPAPAAAAAAGSGGGRNGGDNRGGDQNGPSADASAGITGRDGGGSGAQHATCHPSSSSAQQAGADRQAKEDRTQQKASKASGAEAQLGGPAPQAPAPATTLNQAPLFSQPVQGEAAAVQEGKEAEQQEEEEEEEEGTNLWVMEDGVLVPVGLSSTHAPGRAIDDTVRAKSLSAAGMGGTVGGAAAGGAAVGGVGKHDRGPGSANGDEAENWSVGGAGLAGGQVGGGDVAAPQRHAAEVVMQSALIMQDPALLDMGAAMAMGLGPEEAALYAMEVEMQQGAAMALAMGMPAMHGAHGACMGGPDGSGRHEGADMGMGVGMEVGNHGAIVPMPVQPPEGEQLVAGHGQEGDMEEDDEQFWREANEKLYMATAPGGRGGAAGEGPGQGRADEQQLHRLLDLGGWRQCMQGVVLRAPWLCPVL